MILNIGHKVLTVVRGNEGEDQASDVYACNCGRAIKVPLPANGGSRVIGSIALHAARFQSEQ